MPDKLRVGSLFAGIGGLELGLEWTGHFETVWQVELDEFARKILAKHWPDVPRHDDVCTFPPSGFDWSCDVLTGGFPCQDLSYAGKGAGLDGKRSGLFYELARVVRVLGPRYVVLENVSALLSRGMGDVIGTLASLGYDCQWHCIPAAAVGAPHRRDRVFILADADRQRKPQSQGCQQQKRRRISDGSKAMADAHGKRRKQNAVGLACESGSTRTPAELSQKRGEARTTEKCTNATGKRLEGFAQKQILGKREVSREFERMVPRLSEQWAVEPELGRVANGIPSRVDRLKCLGNAVVPQVAQVLGEILWSIHNGKHEPQQGQTRRA
jgi:DNA (cytosine-5)-methyltransferase 1